MRSIPVRLWFGHALVMVEKDEGRMSAGAERRAASFSVVRLRPAAEAAPRHPDRDHHVSGIPD